MQGRLLPPQDGRFQCFPVQRWREEFPAAAAAGLNAIEWIYDLAGAEKNPIASDRGIDEMREFSRLHGIEVVSLCADYFMDRPLVTANTDQLADLTSHLIWLLGRCHEAGITRIVLPFVDASRIETVQQETQVIEVLREVLRRAAGLEVEIHLETSLDPNRFAALLDSLAHPLLRANYDSGNSASLGYDVREEFAVYGHRIGSVHIKDRVCNGGTVPLGTGATDFPNLAACLAHASYRGDYVLQTARGLPGDEIAWARQNRAFLAREVLQSRRPVAEFVS